MLLPGLQCLFNETNAEQSHDSRSLSKLRKWPECAPGCATNYRVSPALSMIHVPSRACRRHATKIHGAGTESTSFTSSLRRVATTSPERRSGRRRLDTNKWALVTIKLRAKEGRKTTRTTMRARKMRIYSSGWIVRICQKGARWFANALNLLLACLLEESSTVDEIIKTRVCFWKCYLAAWLIYYSLQTRPLVKSVNRISRKKSLEHATRYPAVNLNYALLSTYVSLSWHWKLSEYYPSINGFVWSRVAR